jgi:hypothetical protein
VFIGVVIQVTVRCLPCWCRRLTHVFACSLAYCASLERTHGVGGRGNPFPPTPTKGGII